MNRKEQNIHMVYLFLTFSWNENEHSYKKVGKCIEQ